MIKCCEGHYPFPSFFIPKYFWVPEIPDTWVGYYRVAFVFRPRLTVIQAVRNALLLKIISARLFSFFIMMREDRYQRHFAILTKPGSVIHISNGTAGKYCSQAVGI